MEEQYTHTVDGEATAEEDINLIALNAALADDRVLGALFGPQPIASGGKYILPLGSRDLMQPVVRPKASASSMVCVAPFRAFLGSTGTVTGDLRDNRSAPFAGTSIADANSAEIAIAATTTNNRIDLVYARIDRDINTPNVSRPVKDAAETVTTQSLVVSKRCTVTVSTVQGVEAATPSPPALPADSGGAYYIPLAYVRLVHPHTAVTQIATSQIWEAAPILPLNRRTGSAIVQPLEAQWAIGGAIMASATAGIGVSGVVRPKAFIPPTAMGLELYDVALGFNGSGVQRSIPLGATTTLDTSRDWRGRKFLSFWHFLGGAGDFAWNGNGSIPTAPYADATGAPAHGVTSTYMWGESMHPAAGSITWDGVSFAGGIAKLAPVNMSAMALNSVISFFVDLTTGALKVKVSATDPNGHLVGLIAAFGTHPNRSP